METVYIVAKSAMSEKWHEWIDALVASDFKIRKLAPEYFESPTYETTSDQVFIVDGMLPDLTGIALGIVSQYPDAHIIVASECDSFTIYYEVLQMGAVYFPPSMSPKHLVKAVRERIANRSLPKLDGMT